MLYAVCVGGSVSAFCLTECAQQLQAELERLRKVCSEQAAQRVAETGALLATVEQLKQQLRTVEASSADLQAVVIELLHSAPISADGSLSAAPASFVDVAAQRCVSPFQCCAFRYRRVPKF